MHVIDPIVEAISLNCTATAGRCADALGIPRDEVDLVVDGLVIAEGLEWRGRLGYDATTAHERALIRVASCLERLAYAHELAEQAHRRDWLGEDPLQRWHLLCEEACI